MKLFHVVESMHDQAAENGIFSIMRESRLSHPDVQWTFYSALGKPGRLDDAVRDLGAEVIYSPVPIGDTRRFISAFRATLLRDRYDILHTHHDIVSAVYLGASLGTGLRRRIVHIHNTSMDLPTPSRIKKAVAWEPMRRTCLMLADRIVGVSETALLAMVLKNGPRQPRDSVVYCGIDTERFRNPRTSREAIRASIGVGPDTNVLLFAGRMTDYKNPQFVVEVLAEIAAETPDAVAVFAGVGPATDAVRQRATDSGVSERIRIVGWRDDLPELMFASDLMLWPGSEFPREGLGLAIVEAQAAGLPVVMSRSVPNDAIVIPEIVSVVPLAKGAGAWGREAFRILNKPRLAREDALARIERSPFSLAAATRNTMALYDDLPPR